MAIKKIDNMCQRQFAFKHIKNQQEIIEKMYLYNKISG